MDMNQKLRKELTEYLENERTHIGLAKAMRNLPEKLINKKSKGMPYTFWGLLEHVRIAQHDMVEFIQTAEYEKLDWPEGYWPSPKTKATKAMWKKSLTAIEKDLDTLKGVIQDPAVDLFAPIPWGHGQTAFREVIQIIDHASHHLGQLILMRRLAGDWKKKR
jgi:uncharacterized damage-inducible protein DinB